MRFLVLLLVLAVPARAGADILVRDTAHEEDVLNTFRALCLDTGGNAATVRRALLDRGAEELPSTMARGLLAGKKGRAWKVDGAYGLYAASLMEDGTCQVFGYRIAPAKMMELFERDTVRTARREQVLRDEIRTYYTIRYKRPGLPKPKEMKVMLQHSSHSGADGMALYLLPGS